MLEVGQALDNLTILYITSAETNRALLSRNMREMQASVAKVASSYKWRAWTNGAITVFALMAGVAAPITAQAGALGTYNLAGKITKLVLPRATNEIISKTLKQIAAMSRATDVTTAYSEYGVQGLQGEAEKLRSLRRIIEGDNDRTEGQITRTMQAEEKINESQTMTLKALLGL
jgi:hypothetical protein